MVRYVLTQWYRWCGLKPADRPRVRLPMSHQVPTSILMRRYVGEGGSGTCSGTSGARDTCSRNASRVTFAPLPSPQRSREHLPEPTLTVPTSAHLPDRTPTSGAQASSSQGDIEELRFPAQDPEFSIYGREGLEWMKELMKVYGETQISLAMSEASSFSSHSHSRSWGCEMWSRVKIPSRSD